MAKRMKAHCIWAAAPLCCCFWLAIASGQPPKVPKEQSVGQQSAQHQQQLTNAPQKSNDDQRGSEQTPLVVRVYKSNESEEDTRAEQQDRNERASTDSRMFWVAVFTLLILIVQAIVFLWQGTQLKRTVVEMKAASTTSAQMRDAAQKQTRAYVYVSGIPNSLSLLPNSNLIVEYQFWFKWENSGLTPAILCAMWTAFKQVPISDQTPITFTKEGLEATRVPLGPKQGIDSNHITISAVNLVNIFEKKTRCYIWGLAEYRDVFSNREEPLRHTEICLEVLVSFDPRLPVDQRQPPALRFEGIQQHNSSS